MTAGVDGEVRGDKASVPQSVEGNSVDKQTSTGDQQGQGGGEAGASGPAGASGGEGAGDMGTEQGVASDGPASNQNGTLGSLGPGGEWSQAQAQAKEGQSVGEQQVQQQQQQPVPSFPSLAIPPPLGSTR